MTCSVVSFNIVIVLRIRHSFTKEGLHNIAETTLLNVNAFMENQPLANEVVLPD